MIKKIKQFLCNHSNIQYLSKEELNKDIIYNTRCKKCGLEFTVHKNYR